MRIVMPACLLGLVLLGGAGLTGCQQDRAATRLPTAAEPDGSPQGQTDGSARSQGDRRGIIKKNGSQTGTIRNEQDSGYLNSPN